MPSIPSYNAPQVAARGVSSQGFSMRAPDASGLTQGIAQVERGVMQRFEEEREKADTAAIMDADRQLTEWQNQTMFDPERGVYTRKGSNALNVTNQTLKDFEDVQARIGQTMQGEAQQARFNEIVLQRRQRLSGELNKYEFQERQSHYDSAEQGQIETSIQTAALYYNDPEQIALNRGKMAAVLQSRFARKGLPPEAQEAERLKFHSAMSKSVLNSLANEDPYRARDYLEQTKAFLTAEDQVQMDQLISRQIKSRELEARQLQAIAKVELTSRVQDAEAAYLQGLDFDNVPSREEFIGAYGDEDGAERYNQFVKVQGLGSSIRELATASPEDRAAIIDRFNPAENGVASEGFRVDSQLYGTAIKAVMGLGKELQDDPASYAAKYSPVIRGAIEALQSGEPEAAQAYAAATIAEQQRLGAPEPKLLTKGQVDAITRQFDMTGDGGSNAAAMINQLSQQWGKHWPAVYQQLQPKLPGAALVIGSGVDEATAATLARIAPLKDDELKRGLESTDVSDARATLNESLAPFRHTLAQQAGGERTYATIHREAERLTYAYMGQGKAPEDAVRAAVASLVEDKYSIRGSWRAPKMYDADQIERGAELAVASVDPDTLAFAVPQGVSPEFAKQQVKTAIERDSYWVTTPDESGLALYYGGGAVLDKEGNPIIRGWDDLIGTSLSEPSAWDQFNDGRNKMRQGPARAGSGGSIQ